MTCTPTTTSLLMEAGMPMPTETCETCMGFGLVNAHDNVDPKLHVDCEICQGTGKVIVTNPLAAVKWLWETHGLWCIVGTDTRWDWHVTLSASGFGEVASGVVKSDPFTALDAAIAAACDWAIKQKQP